MSKQTGGNLPLTLKVNREENLKNYRIYGNSDGAGVETENKFNVNTTWYKQNPNDVIEIGKNEVTITASLYDYVKIDVEANTDYTLEFEYQSIVGSMHRATVATQDLATILLRIDGTSGTFNTGNNTSIAILFYAGGGSQGKTKYKNIILTLGSTVPVSFIPPGYKIPISLESGVTENLVPEISTANGWRPGYINSNGSFNPNNTNGEWLSPYIDINVTTVLPITIKYKPVSSSASLSLYFFDANGDYISKKSSTVNGNVVFTSEIPTNATKMSYAFRTYCITEQDLIQAEMWTSFYAPYRYEQNYDLMIGSTKLGEEEYVDYESGKIYRKAFDWTYKITTAVNPQNPEGLYVRYAYQTDGFYNDMFSHWGYVNVHETVDTLTVNTEGATVKEVEAIQGEVPAGILVRSGVADYGEGTTAVAFVKTNAGEYIYADLFAYNYDYTKANEPITPPSTPCLYPTDPPAPLPAIQAYQGENTLSSSETTGDVIINYGNDNISTIQLNNTLYNIIDESFYSIVADNYNTQQSYSEGDYCIYNYQLYKCNANTSGNWDASKWTLTNLAEWVRGD